MLSRRSVLLLLSSASLSAVSAVALAKKKIHKNGKNLLGAKIKKNGKHQVDKVGKGGKAIVNAEVKGGKVASMTITDANGKEIAGKKIKSKDKMAGIASDNVLVAANERIHLAQLDWYYGWYFDYDDDYYYYWYPADEVYWEDDYWADDWLYW